MTPITKAAAREKYCPFKFNLPEGNRQCHADYCMAWHTVHHEVKRDYNYGEGHNILAGLAVKTNRLIRYANNNNTVILDEVGICSKLKLDK